MSGIAHCIMDDIRRACYIVRELCEKRQKGNTCNITLNCTVKKTGRYYTKAKCKATPWRKLEMVSSPKCQFLILYSERFHALCHKGNPFKYPLIFLFCLPVPSAFGCSFRPAALRFVQLVERDLQESGV